MATPPRAPRIQGNTVTRTVPATEAQPVTAVLMEQPTQSRASVEIETMTRGIPKVKVRVNDDDPDRALEHALAIYAKALAALTPKRDDDLDLEDA